MIKNTLGDLNGYLFEQLERLNAGELSLEELEIEMSSEVWFPDKNTYFSKIADPDVWVNKKRYLWEQAHGPIPDDHVILCKDNNPRNVTLDNLLMVSHGAMTSVAKHGLRTEYPEINEALHTLAELEMKLKKKK